MSGTFFNRFIDDGATPLDEYKAAHRDADTDHSSNAIHHTLGGSSFQAAPGNRAFKPGDLKLTAGDYGPDWLKCDGSWKTIALYQTLYKELKARYNVQEDEASFKLPNVSSPVNESGLHWVIKV